MLEGEVRWQFQRKLAESAVRGTDGVASISNTMTIKTNVSTTKVKDQIEASLRRSAELEARRITVEVEGNRVILRGSLAVGVPVGRDPGAARVHRVP